MVVFWIVWFIWVGVLAASLVIIGHQKFSKWPVWTWPFTIGLSVGLYVLMSSLPLLFLL